MFHIVEKALQKKLLTKFSSSLPARSFASTSTTVHTTTQTASLDPWVPVRQEQQHHPLLVYPLESKIELQRVPSLPYVGSLLPIYSKVPVNEYTNDRKWCLDMRKRFGDFYSYGIPGMGEGTHGTTYCKLIHDRRFF